MINKTTTISIPALLLVASSAIHAADANLDLHSRTSNQGDWRTFSADMSPAQYRRTYRNNIKSARKMVESYSRKTLTSLGVPEAGINLVGAAAAFAVTQDAKFYLNRSKLLSVGVKNVADGDRSVFLGVKVKW